MKAPLHLVPLSLAVLFPAVGCHRPKRPPPRYISRLTVSEATLADNPALGMAAADLKDRLVLALDATGRFAPLVGRAKGTRPKGPTYRCRAEVTFTRESDEPDDGGATLRRAEVGLLLGLSPTGDGEPLREEASARRIFDPAARGSTVNARSQAFQAALSAALQSAVRALVLDLDAIDEPDDQLIRDLASPEGPVRDCAVRQLADRRNPAAVPALLERLKDPDRQLVLRAMGALAAIRDPRSVKPLIDLTERADPAFVVQVVYVLGTIGGGDAEAFLYTLRNGSPDAQVRAAAAEATAELHHRRPAADPPPAH